MAKNARWGQTSTAPQIVLAAQSKSAHEMFAGKTLRQVGGELELNDEDVKWGIGINPKTNEEIKSLLIKKGEVWYQVPLSRGIKEDMLGNPELLLNCMFRAGFMSVKDADGAPKVDENGAILLDESKPYLSFGRPNGIVVARMETVFDEPVEGSEPTEADTTELKA